MNNQGVGVIYVRQGDELVQMRETKYESEDLLQSLLAEHPGLLAGEQIDTDDARRWLFVHREIGVPDSADGSDRWALDHLFLDQDGIPTLVEVKRSSDTRLRREVVGQMLDYAANAVAHWPLDRIRAEFDRTCEADSTTTADVLTGFLEAGTEEESFWDAVKTNLQAGRVRMVFVADVIPTELRRIVDFLAEQLDPATAFALEVRQYSGDELSALVPRVVAGHAAQTLTTRAATRFDPDAFAASFDDPAYREAVKSFLEGCRARGLVFSGSARGTSFRITTGPPRREVSVGWLAAPGVSGWSGLRDLNAGFDTTSYAADHRLHERLKHYAERVMDLEGAEPMAPTALLGAHFKPETVAECAPQILAAIDELIVELREGGDMS